MEITSKTKFDSHSRGNLNKVYEDPADALGIEIMLIIMNYPHSAREKALLKIIGIVRGQQNDTDREDKGMVIGEDPED